MATQRVEVGVIADARQHRHHHPQPAACGRQVACDGVFGIQVQSVQIRQHAQHRLAGACFQPAQAGFQQRDVAAKTVDDEALDPRLFTGTEQFQRPDQVGEHTAAIDVGHKNHRAVHRLGEAHVGNVAVTKIDLGRRPRAFDNHRLKGGRQTCVRGQHRGHRHLFVVVVSPRIHLGHGLAVNDHLRSDVGAGFEQHRIQVGDGRDARRLGLQGLGAADLAAVGGHRRVQRHVLRLERRHPHAAPLQHPAQTGHQRGLAGIRRGALHHEAAAAHAAPGARVCNARRRRSTAGASPGRPKRRLAGDAKRRTQMPCRASAACRSAASGVTTR